MDVMHANYCNDVIVMVERSLSYVKICDQFPLKVSRLILRCNSYVTHM